MNQILSIDDSYNKKATKSNKQSEPMDLKLILRFFSIAIIVFGVFMIGTGTYAMYKNQGQSSNSIAKPSITVESATESTLTLKVIHDKAIQEAYYSWEDEDTIDLKPNGNKSIEQTIDIPAGTNTLKVYAKDINGLESTCQKKYTLVGKIEIKFEVSGTNIKATVNGQDRLTYMTYKWDDGEETREDIDAISKDIDIEIPDVGQHTLTVYAEDINGNKQTQTQEVEGVVKPKIEISKGDNDSIIIKASDDVGLSKVEFIIDETDKYKLELDGRTELEYTFPYPLHDGQNKMEITVYNTKNAKETIKGTITK